MYIILLAAVAGILLCTFRIKEDYNTWQKNRELKFQTEKLNQEIEVLSAKQALEKQKISLLEESFYKQQQLSNDALGKYFLTLENKYEDIEKDFKDKINSLQEDFFLKNETLKAETDILFQQLEEMKKTRAAAIEAKIREQSIQENLSFYCIEISDLDKADIRKIEVLKKDFMKPRVLSMLIWQTWFQKPFKALLNNIVGLNDKCGIYKITNVQTNECYIGQSRNIKDRLTEHVKCGLGIDTPAGNKLYKAMNEYGVWNFSFEVLEECSTECLNEKEKIYIDLYCSKDFGYNSIAAPVIKNKKD